MHPTSQALLCPVETSTEETDEGHIGTTPILPQKQKSIQ